MSAYTHTSYYDDPADFDRWVQRVQGVLTHRGVRVWVRTVERVMEGYAKVVVLPDTRAGVVGMGLLMECEYAAYVKVTWSGVPVTTWRLVDGATLDQLADAVQLALA